MEPYYTPQLSEIYFGFEFEAYNSKKHFFFEKEEKWYSVSIDYGVLGKLINLHKLLMHKQIRVKFLDKTDIERCGWIYKDINEPQLDYFWDSETEKHSISYNYKTHRMIITGREDISKEDYSAFNGFIKNKSELKKIMEQLRIK